MPKRGPALQRSWTRFSRQCSAHFRWKRECFSMSTRNQNWMTLIFGRPLLVTSWKYWLIVYVWLCRSFLYKLNSHNLLLSPVHWPMKDTVSHVSYMEALTSLFLCFSALKIYMVVEFCPGGCRICSHCGSHHSNFSLLLGKEWSRSTWPRGHCHQKHPNYHWGIEGKKYTKVITRGCN